MRRVAIYAVLLCAVQMLSAQIRIIPQERVLEAANPKSVTSPLRFSSEVVDFGTIDEMSGVWQGSVDVMNTGGDTIAITQVKSTCGCLQIGLPKRVLAPRESVKATLKYYPRGHAGRITQRVLLYTNVSEKYPSAIVQLRGVVTASADRSDDYPYTRGTLRLRQEEVHFGVAGRQVQRIACMNGGSTELRLAVDTLLTSRGVRVRFEPSILAPKQEGDMIVEYEPQRDIKEEKALKIYLKLPNVAPRYGVVEVRICDKE